MKQAPDFDGLPFDPFSALQDRVTASEVEVGRCEVLQVLVMASEVVVSNEDIDPSVKGCKLRIQ